MSIPTNSGNVSTYAERVARHVPGLEDLHRMAGILLAERVPASGRVLVLGAGGGLELRAFVDWQPGWQFDAVDPSPEMLDQARTVLSDTANRVTFHEGYITDAPEGPFDGATCLLTLHFLAREERLCTLQALHQRLQPGAPFVVAHHSFPQDGLQRDLWLRRNADLLVSKGVPMQQAEQGIMAMKERLPALSPEEDEALFLEAGFGEIQLFYAGFTFKGWVCYRV
ncbi:class I SAM-dependent methyltransferase [Pusillimonas sp.]|uniref:class I SAM-dependent methyltransferase n=1 Tax=Pusillimonas sp. TaxID=3040095 RepID=UPI0037CCB5A9